MDGVTLIRFGTRPRLRISAMGRQALHRTHYIPFQKPSSMMLFRMQSIAPVYCGDNVDNPAICNFRRKTSNGWVKMREIAPDSAPLPSFRTARLTSEMFGS